MKKIFSIALMFFMTLGLNAQIDRSHAPKSGETPEIKLPEAHTLTLDNGLKIIVVENHKLPTVNFTLKFDIDPIFSDNKAGMIDIFGEMMNAGTKTKTREQINEEIESLGGTLSTNPTGISISTLAKNDKEAFALFSDILLNPSFPQAEFDKVVNQFLTGIKANEKDSKAIAKRATATILYGENHPYGEITTSETVKNININDIKEFYGTYFKPNIAYLVVNGDIKTKEVKKLAKKYLNKWKKGDVPTHKYEIPKNPSKTEIDFINVEASTQSIISIVNLANLKTSNPDYFAIKAGSAILGGSGTARLFMNLREDKAYTYGAYSRIYDDKIIGKFYAGASVRNAVTDSSVVQLLMEINKIRYEKVTDAELSKQKNSIFGAFARTLESPSTIASFYLNEQMLNLPKGFYANYLKKVNKVTKDDIQKALNTYVQPDNCRIIIVGKAVDVVPGLKKLGYKINYFDIYGRPTDAPSLAKPIPAGVTISTLINDMAKALGGKDKLTKVKSLHQNFTMQMGPYAIEGYTKVMTPHSTITEMKMQGTVIMKSVFDGKKGYIMQQGQKVDFKEAQIKESLGTEVIFPWLYFENEKYNTKLEGIVPVDGSEAYKLEVTIEGSTSYLYVDINSKLIVQQEKISEINGQKISQLTFLKGYKEFDGIKFPTSIATKAGPQTMEMKVTTIEVNKGVKKSDFK